MPIREIADRWIGKFAEGTTAALLALRTTLQETDEERRATWRTGTDGEKPKHVFTVFIKAEPERVWEAITRSDFTVQYYFASTVESDWQPGSPYTYAIQGEPAIVGEVLESDPPRRLVCTFDARWDDEVAPDPPSRISWEIVEAGPGVSQLTVVHDGFEAEDATFGQIGGGMPFILSGLKTLLETGRAADAGAGGGERLIRSAGHGTTARGRGPVGSRPPRIRACEDRPVDRNGLRRADRRGAPALRRRDGDLAGRAAASRRMRASS